MKKLNEMTLKEKLGQLLVVGFSGYEYNDHLRKLVEEYKVGNVILFVRNIKNLEQLSKLNKDIHNEIIKHTGVMPLITIDQEGGIVTRIMNGATFCPGNMTLAATNVENASIIGKIMGEELAHLGINMNLAPVLDVNNNIDNPVIGVRSYSDDPEIVTNYGIRFIKGLQEKGIIATAKHFPGHGDTNVDSHLGLPTVAHSKERLAQVELVPFKKAIAAGLDAIMSAHIVFKAYEEEDIPGTISRNVITNLLREELGFEGLIVSDCMEMKAIDDTYTTPVGVVKGIAAGLDLAFVSHTLEKQIKALELLEEAVNNGEISMKEIDQKVERILKFKAKTEKIIKRDFINNENNLEYFNNNQNNRDIAQKIVDDSLTLIKGEPYKEKGKTLLLAPVPYATTIAEDKLDSRNILDSVKTEIPEIDCLELPMRDIDKSLIEKVKEYDNVIICSYNANALAKQKEMINLLIQNAKNHHIIATRNPYDYIAMDNVQNFVTLYEYTPNSVRTVVKYLKGQITPKGKLPITLKKN